MKNLSVILLACIVGSAAFGSDQNLGSVQTDITAPFAIDDQSGSDNIIHLMNVSSSTCRVNLPRRGGQVRVSRDTSGRTEVTVFDAYSRVVKRFSVARRDFSFTSRGFSRGKHIIRYDDNFCPLLIR